MEETKQVGKIIYVEPNNFINDRLGDRLNISGLDNIPPNPEDLCIAVDIQVEVVNRESCGQNNENNIVHTLSWRNNDGKLSFMGGKKLRGKTTNMFTSDYINTSFNDISGSTNNNEALGITSINIDFTSWFFPIVTINFTDVRGASLMGSEDYLHTADNSTHASSLFKSFFTFPYPKFSLQVKGFYGQAVTFQLAVSDFRASISSDTGNFDVTVKFIGYMYGLLTDIPMSYLIAAPYDEYAGYQYWLSNIQNGRFTFDNGETIPTFTEFLERVSKLNEELPQYANKSEVMQSYNKLRNEIGAMEDILTTYNAYAETINDGINKLIGEKHILFTSNNPIIYGDISYKEALIRKIESFNTNYTALSYPNNDRSVNTVYNCIVLFGNYNNEIRKKAANSLTDKFGRLSYENELKNKGWYDSIYGENGDKRLINLIDKWTTGEGSKNVVNNPLGLTYAYLYVTDGFVEEIKTRIKTKSAEIEKLAMQVDEFQKRTSEEALKFVPSIENITKMTMAHLETFMSSMYHCFDAINNNGSLEHRRTLSSLGMSVGETDINGSVNSEVFVPPFPLYTERTANMRGQTPVWVGNKMEGDPMEEESLINGILEGAKKVKTMVDHINESYLQNTTKQIDFIPSCLTDINIKQNPYKYIFDGSQSTLKIDELYTHFGVRLVNYLTNDIRVQKTGIDDWLNFTLLKGDQEIEFNTSIKTMVENFANCEAFNYFKSHPQEDTRLMETMMAPENGDTKNIINFLTNTSPIIWGGINKKPIYKTKTTNDTFFNVSKTIRNALEYNWVNDPIEPTIKIIPTKFDNIRKIDPNNINNFYRPIDLNGDNTINQNIFYVDEDVNKYRELVKIVNEADTPDSIDKSLTLLNWELGLTGYENYYSNDQTVNRPLISHVSDAFSEIGENADVLPINFRTPEERNRDGIVKNLFYNKPKETEGAKLFYGGRWERKTKQTIEKYINRELSIGDMAFFNIMCGTNSSLYGHPFFYQQNSIEDDNTKNNVKALLLLHSLPIVEKTALKNLCDKLFKGIKESIVTEVPISSILFLGALLWRERYYENNNDDCFIYGRYNKPQDLAYKYLLTKDAYLRPTKELNKKFIEIESMLEFPLFSLRRSIKNMLIRFFEAWVVSDKEMGFRHLNWLYELKFVNDEEITADKLEKLINIVNTYFDKNGIRLPNKKISNELKSLFSIEDTDVLEDVYRKNFSDNLCERYMKMSISKIDNAFMLQCRQTSVANEYLLNFILRNVVVLSVDKSNCLNTIENKKIPLITESLVEVAYSAFRRSLMGYYGYNESNKKRDEIGEKRSARTNINSTLSDDMKLSTYLTLKNMYDRWLCANDLKRWQIDSDNGIYKNFVFIDSFYEPIGQKLMLNLNAIVENLDAYHMEQSLYEFLSVIYQKSNVLFLATPIYNNWKSSETIETMFTPIPFSKMNTKEPDSTLICLYSHEPSKHLDLDSVGVEYGYKNDSFNIADSYGNVAPIPITQLGTIDGGQQIPAFGVTVGKQNQNFFKKVTVSMDNPQVTEQSLLAVQEIANNNSSEPNRQISYVGQDLFKVYSNHSYTCNVEMMGCAPILPLMYFQLNNYPMFKGTYMVKGVSHTITPGDMTTNFSGVRLSKYNTPLLTEIFNVNDLLSQQSDNSIIRNTQLSTDSSFIETTSNAIYSSDEITPFIWTGTTTPTYEELTPYVYWGTNVPKSNYDLATDELKITLYEIARTAYEQTEFKVFVTSMVRPNAKPRSDHHPNQRLAVDMHGTPKDYKNGDSEKILKKYSAQLFDLIALNFTDKIHQLIWEDKGGGETQYRDNIVNNVIHLGIKGGRSVKTQIFQSADFNGVSIPITDAETLMPLSTQMLGTLAELISKDQTITLNNFNNFSGKTSDDYKEKLLKMKIPRSAKYTPLWGTTDFETPWKNS